jgi:hypothetical protein
MLEGAGILRSLEDGRHRSEGDGQMPIAGLGSLTAGLLPPILDTFERAGAASYIGPILLGEAAKDLRETCRREMPATFHARLTELKVPAFPFGFGGASLEEMLEPGMRRWWETDNMRTASKWADRIDHNTAITKVNAGLLLAILSNNGHAALAPDVLREFKRRYPLAPIYALTVLDAHTSVRERFPEVHDLLTGEGLVRGFISIDNLGDQKRYDFGLVQLLAAMTTGQWIASKRDQQTALNGLNAIFPATDPGQTGTISVTAETVPALYLPESGRRQAIYYTSGSLLAQKIVQGIERVVTDETLQALPLRAARKGNARVLCVIAPVVPDFLRTTSLEVEERLGAWLKERDVDLVVQYASIGQPLTPDGTAIISFVLLQRVEATDKQLADYARGKVRDNPAVLAHVAGNGHSKRLNRGVAKQLSGSRKG